jgi:integrase
LHFLHLCSTLYGVKQKNSWTKSKISNLYRHDSSGIYYARSKVNGVDKWATLETDVFSVAQLRLSKKLAELKQGQGAAKAFSKGIATFGEAAEIYAESVEADTVRLKPLSIKYRKRTIIELLKSWPGLSDRKLGSVTERECEDWFRGYSKRLHGTRVNNTLDTLRHIFQLGIDRGIIFKNPAENIDKVKVAQKKLELPSVTQFNDLVQEIETNGTWCARDCADMVRFLAYSGCRISEAINVTWKDVDGARGVIWIHGDQETGTKSGKSRAVPIIAPMRELLERLSAEPREPIDPDRRARKCVLVFTECTVTLTNACEKLGIPHLTHHDLRHLFATRCIESGVDIPTVSRFLGHADGGALAMRTYGHLRDEHSQAMAAKVSF